MSDSDFTPDDGDFVPDVQQPKASGQAPKHNSILSATVKGYAAGGAAGHDDEMGAGVQMGLKWLAKHAGPKVASLISSGGMDPDAIDPHVADDPTVNFGSAVADNRRDKALAQKERPWAFGVGDAFGTGALQAAGTELGIPPGAMPTIYGGLRAEGDADEHRGFNWQTGGDVVKGMGTGYVAGKLGEKIGGGLSKLGKGAQSAADAADARISQEAAPIAERLAGEANGAAGPLEAEARKSVRDILTMKHTRNWSPADEAELSAIKPKFDVLKGDIKNSAIDAIGKLEQHIPVSPADFAAQAKSQVESQLTSKLNGQMWSDAKGIIKEIPVVHSSLALANHAYQRFNNDVVKRGLSQTVADILSANPETFERWGRAIVSSTAPQITHHILQQRDPEYREALRKAGENGNE